MMRRTLLGASALLLITGPHLGELRLAEAAPARLPAGGLVGDQALREAVEYRQLMEQIAGEVRAAQAAAGIKEGWAWVRALYPDMAVVSVSNGNGPEELRGYPFEVAPDGKVTLGTWTPVVETFSPVSPAATVSEGSGTVTAVAEAAAGEPKPARFKVVVIQAGLSKNANYYPDKALREAVPLIENAPVFEKSDADHIAGRGKDVGGLIGRIVEATFVAGATPDTGRIEGVLELIDPDHATSVKIREAVTRGMQNLFGLSIDAHARVVQGKAGKRVVHIAEAFTKVNSVDLIVEPGAGGRVISIVEAAGFESPKEVDVGLTEIIALIKQHRPELLEGVDLETLDVAAAMALLAKAMAPVAPAGQPTQVTEAAAREAANTAIRLFEARQAARDQIARSGLPQVAKDKLTARFAEATDCSTATVTAAIQSEAAYIGRFAEAGRVGGLGGLGSVEFGEGQAEKIAAMFDAFFDTSHRDHRHARSFRECYEFATGDRRVTGRIADATRLTEALNSTSFAEVLGDSISRRMIAMYNSAGLPDFTPVTGDPVNVNDFRTQHRTRWGGYGDLPGVDEGANYQPMTSPTDEEATYAISKRGGTESVTLEMIANDDVGVIRQIPVKLGRAAARTLNRFVFNGLLNSNPTIYDGKALFHADHGNLGTTALSKEAYTAARLAMFQQTEYGTGEDRIGLNPRFLLIPAELEEVAYNMFVRMQETDPQFVSTLKPTVIVVPHWTDPNDWMLAHNPLDVPGIEIGFLNGQEEPELFVQDNPSVGSMFSADKITYKIRHIYGGAVKDWRQFRKHVVPAPGGGGGGS